MNTTSRRSAILKFGALIAGAGTVPDLIGKELDDVRILPGYAGNTSPVSRPLTAIVIGAGNRGNVYAGYALKYPDELKIVGVAEPIEHKNERFAKAHGIPDENRFPSWEYVFQRPKFADAVIITTPDNLHYGPAMKALPLGYNMILEKVVAQSWKECNDILQAAVKFNSIVAVCHVLRYTAYFRKLKELVSTGFFGDILSVQHMEPVGHIHMSHSFVRGPWRNSKESNPMILSKSCHDTDILRWLIDKPCKKVSSFGELSLFRKENAPAGSPLRCTDGCPVEAHCPYSALKVYQKNRWYLGHLNLVNETDEEILEKLKTTRYGICVYKMDNDVVDHQICNFEFEGGITAAFSMEAMTPYGGRRTRIMGTKGHTVGDESDLECFNLETGESLKWNVNQAEITSGHGGGDYGLVHDFVRASLNHDPSLLTSTVQASMESHLMGFMAEKSRLADGKSMDIKM
ncbi:MAG: Gfo/Idh/MocA family oxidoreductase [Bacteroidales bacterium]|nr:Gfo/Idh/MocA family oxidoreductase [Bacteroidales bacterium]